MEFECEECGEISEAELWEQDSPTVECEDCGDHPAYKCPDCWYLYDSDLYSKEDLEYKEEPNMNIDIPHKITVTKKMETESVLEFDISDLLKSFDVPLYAVTVTAVTPGSPSSHPLSQNIDAFTGKIVIHWKEITQL